MGEFQAIHKYLAVFVVLIAIHLVVLTEGRQMKALNQHSSLDKDTSTDGNIPTSAVTAVQSNYHVNAAFGDSNVGYVNAHRPTTPGNSPGVGHRKFGEENEDIEAKWVVRSPPDVDYSLTEGSKTDFRPTDPVHNPSVGHAAHQELKA